MTVADRILIVLVVCAMPFLYLHLWFGHETANFVQIRNGNDAPITETLLPDRMLHVAGRIGDSIIEIRNGRTRFASSPCKTQVCVHGGWLTRAGAVAACLPNRISLTLVGREPHFDSISF